MRIVSPAQRAVVIVTKSEIANSDSSTSTVTVFVTVEKASASTDSTSTLTITKTAVTSSRTSNSGSSTDASSNAVSFFTSSHQLSLTSDVAITSSASATATLVSSTLSNSKLGLAIGLPIAAVAVFGFVVFGLIYIKKRMGSDNEEQLKFTSKTNGSHHKEQRGCDAYKGDSHDELELNFGHEQSLTYIESPPPKSNILKRISRLMTAPDLPLEFKSPIFLRRFNLMRGEDQLKDKDLPRTPTINPSQGHSLNHSSGAESDTDQIYVVTKPYARRLGDELTICIGEKVKIMSLHTDGWATVQTLQDGAIGVIPLMCIRKKAS